VSQAALPELHRGRPGRTLAVVLLASLAVHGAGFLALARVEERTLVPPQRPVELVMVEVAPPPPPPPPEVKEAPRPVVKPPVRMAVTQKVPPPVVDAPPPPNDTPPPEAAKPAPLVIGISMSSTTSAGSFSAPVGNTAYGKTADRATAAQDVKGYSAPKYVPIYQVDSEPSVASEVKIPYPDEARRAGVEGTVTLSITVDATGTVTQVKLLSGPGYGLNEAARDAIRRFKFKPATKGGHPVATEMKYAYTFLLD